MMKVRILDRCEFCDGEVKVPAEDTESSIVEQCFLQISPNIRLAYPVLRIGLAWVCTGVPRRGVE